MFRLIIFIFLVIVTVLAVRAIIAPRSENEEPDPKSTDMVEDPNCHIYIPKT